MALMEIQPHKRNDSKQCRKDRTIVDTNGTVVNFKHYIQYDRHPKNFHNLGISAVNKYKKTIQVQRKIKIWQK